MARVPHWFKKLEGWVFSIQSAKVSGITTFVTRDYLTPLRLFPVVCMLLPMARMEVDGDSFFSSFDTMLSKITKKVLWLALPDKIH